MARIILKCPYLKGGEKTSAHLNNLVKYIATRDGEKDESGHKLGPPRSKSSDCTDPPSFDTKIYLNMQTTVGVPTGKRYRIHTIVLEQNP